MHTSTIAAAALMASAALAQSVGKAFVINGCQHEVHVQNTPAADGGADPIYKVLRSQHSYNQTYTQLSNGMGWSIKLSPNEDMGTDILQYEYTFHNDGTIWYDLSEVDGNPWNGNWEITANGGDGCKPRQAAYRNSTDDAYGMQDCNSDATVTVVLCSGEEQNDGLASAIAEGSFDPYTFGEDDSTSTAEDVPVVQHNVVQSDVASAASSSAEVFTPEASTPSVSTPAFSTPVATTPTVTPTTFATATTEVAPGITITEVATAVVTEIVTMTHFADKREAHEHRHAARHPHARV